MSSQDSQRSTGPVFDFFFLRPVPTAIWIFLLLVFGILGYRSMVKESLPDLEIPEFYVLTTWEGATPFMVEKEVTQELERELRSMPGLKRLYSSSMYSRSIVAVTFEADQDLDQCMRRIQQQVTLAQGELPSGAERPEIQVSSVNDIPIVSIALSGDVDISVLEELSREVKQRLDRVAGIRRVLVRGSRTEVVQVRLNPQQLASLALPPTLIREQIRSHGIDAPWGTFAHPDLEFTLRLDGAYNEVEDLRQLVVARLDNGHVVRLEDVARVEFGHLRETTRAALSREGSDFEPVVALEVTKAPGHDTIALVEQARRVLEEHQDSPFWPQGVEWRLVGSQAEAITTELDRGFTNGWQSMLAVFAILFVLLTWREAVVAAISVPLTLLGSMATLWALGYTFNLLTIVGMILALGLLVDDFILIMEGMHEGIFLKRLGFTGSVKRTIRNYAVPSFSGSVTTILVFVPLACVGGVDGKFIRVIPVTASVCLAMSYIVSVLLGPSMSRLFLSRAEHKGPGTVDRFSHRAEQALSRWLGSSVVGSRKQALLWVLGAFLLFVFSVFAATGLRDTLYPKEDGRTLGIAVELAPGTTLDQSQAVAEELGEILKHKPFFEHIMRITGGKDAYSLSSFHDYLGRNQGENIIGFACFLTPGKERDRLAFEYVDELRAELEEALKDRPGVRILMNPAIGGSSGEDAVQIDISGNSLSELREAARQVMAELGTIPGVVDIRDSIGPAGMELEFRPMFEAMNHYGVSQATLAGQMLAYMENEKIATFRRSGTRDDLDIRLGAVWSGPDHNRLQSWEELARLTIINNQGRAVPLWSLAEPVMTQAEHVVFHREGRRSVTVLAKLEGVYVSEVLERMRPRMDEMQENWPDGQEFVFAGEADVEATYRNMLVAFMVAIVLVYAILALLFDSLLYPGIILSTVLFALVGVFLGFINTGMPFSFSAAIGIVALVGIVVNDAIIMIETMRARRKQGQSVFEAAKLGAADRLRPIVSTTVTNFAGLTPLALSDPGWAPLCKAIIFGELTATVGAVVLIPALFVLLTRSKRPGPQHP